MPRPISSLRFPSLLAVTLTLAFVVPAAPQDPATRILDEAGRALGGKDRILAVRTLVLSGAGENGNLGQNLTPDAQLPIFRVTEFRKAFDFTNGRWRQE
ncbi:MAG: hypothetical protein ACREMQ_05830, partial [Longimicrobiales bacterium]